MSYQWVTLEKQFPNSINTGSEWIQLKPGECTDIDMISADVVGVLRYAEKPAASPNFSVKQFVDPITSTLSENECTMFYAYSRWWRISLSTPYRIEYTDFSSGEIPSSFVVEGYQDFNQDGDSKISLVVPSGDGEMFVLKGSAGYVLSSCASASSSFKKSRAYYNIGCSLIGSYYSNCIIGGRVAVAWDGGGIHGTRHYLWDGTDETVELSRNVRKYSEAQEKNMSCAINWSQGLVIANDIVYDLESRKIFRFSGSDSASFISRPYKDPLFRPIRVRKIAFYTTGKTGSFTATIQYGQAEDDLAEQRMDKFVISSSTENRFRHVWTLEQPAKARAIRIKVSDVKGTVGIFQIDGLVEILSDPDAPNSP